MPSSDMCSLLLVEILHLSELEFSTESWTKNEGLTIIYLLSLFISCKELISYCFEINFTSIWGHAHRLSFESIIENSKLDGNGMFHWAGQAILVNWVKVKPHPSPPPPPLTGPFMHHSFYGLTHLFWPRLWTRKSRPWPWPSERLKWKGGNQQGDEDTRGKVWS